MNEISIIKLNAEIENEELKVEHFIGIRFISNRIFYLFE